MKKKSAFRILIPVILITIIAIIAFFSSSWYLNRYVKTRLQDQFSEQTNGQYSLSINSLRMNLLTKSVTFSDVQIKPDKPTPGTATYKVFTSHLNLLGINVIGIIRGKEISVDVIELEKPSVTIVQGIPLKNEIKDTTDFSIYKIIKSFAESVSVNRLEISNFDFKLYSGPDEPSPSLHSDNNHFKLKNLYIGKSTEKLPGLFEADSISLTMNRFSYTTSDSLYTFDVGRMEISYIDSLLWIDSVKVLPNYNKRRFAEIAGKQTDRFNVFAGNLIFRKIDLRKLFEHHSLISSTFDISDLSLTAFRDKNDERMFATPKSLQHLILNAKVYLKIDTIKLDRSFIAYEEVAPGKIKPGRITLNDINAISTGITNDSSLIAKGRDLVLKASCNLMDEGKLYATYVFPMNTDQMVFKCDGFLTNMSLTALNKMIEPTVGVSVKKGHIDTLSFSFNAGETSSKGTMKFLYHDLSLELPEVKNEKKKLKDQLMIFAANTFVIKDSNPRGNTEPREANMHFVRNKQRFMFHYTWKTILSGIKETIGMPE